MTKVSVKVRVKLTPGKKEKVLELSEGAKVQDVLKELGTNRETVVVRRHGKIIPECEPVKDGEEIEVMTIISGG